jgi:hypothetical protein
LHKPALLQLRSELRRQWHLAGTQLIKIQSGRLLNVTNRSGQTFFYPNKTLIHEIQQDLFADTISNGSPATENQHVEVQPATMRVVRMRNFDWSVLRSHPEEELRKNYYLY